MPLLCLHMFSFKNKKMGWLHPLIKFLPTSSEILWLNFFLTAMIILIHFHLLLVNILLCMAVPELCWAWLHQLENRLKKGRGCPQRSSCMLIYCLIQAPVVSVMQESSNGRKGTIIYGSNYKRKSRQWSIAYVYLKSTASLSCAGATAQINVFTGVLVSNICIDVKELSDVCKNLFCSYSCLIRCYGCISPLVIFGLIVLKLLTPVFQEAVWWPVTQNGLCTSRRGISVFSDFVTTPWHTSHSYCQSPQVPCTERDIPTSALPHHTNTRNCSFCEVPWQRVPHKSVLFYPPRINLQLQQGPQRPQFS